MNVLRMRLLSAALTLGMSFAPVASAQQPGAQKPLYDRLGGLKGITVVKVPAAEQKELFDSVGTTKADIIVRE